jgi:hypothetical protein
VWKKNGLEGEKKRTYGFYRLAEMVQAAAYYYHGLILDEGNTEKSHRMAVAALQSAEELLRESKDVAETFHAAPPVSRQATAAIRIHPRLSLLVLAVMPLLTRGVVGRCVQEPSSLRVDEVSS